MGDVVPIRPDARQPSQHPEAVRARARRAQAKTLQTALTAAAKRGSRGHAAAAPAATQPAGAPATSQPAAGPVAAVGAPAGHPDHDHTAHVTGLGLGTVVSASMVAAGYSVLFDVVSKTHTGTTAILRAGLPLETEVIAGLGLHLVARSRLSVWLKVPAAVVCLVVSVQAVQAELAAADGMPKAAAHQREEVARGKPLRACDKPVQPEQKDPPPGEGPTGKLVREQSYAAAMTVYGKSMDGYQTCQTKAQSEHDQSIDLAKVVDPGEGALARAFSWLGAIGSIAFLPLLMAFIAAARHSAGGARP
jgi:hypothetical protein